MCLSEMVRKTIKQLPLRGNVVVYLKKKDNRSAGEPLGRNPLLQPQSPTSSEIIHM